MGLPPEDVARARCAAAALSSFLRWVNLTGWAALAIGNLQLIALTDETVLAAGLAWERGSPSYDPVKSGLRFSTNADTPSWKSCVCCRRP